METLNVPFKPWEYHTYTEMKYIFWRSHHRGVMDHSYKAVFETLPNYDNSYWKPGFVVRFGDGINSWQRDRWETWFLTGEDKKRFAKENKIYNRKIPGYARNQYAIVLGRYRWTKYKWTTYRDYGSIIMMLTGNKVGHIRRYFLTNPYYEMGRYPYKIMKFNLKPEKIFHGVPIGNSVEEFLENLTKELSNEH